MSSVCACARVCEPFPVPVLDLPDAWGFVISGCLCKGVLVLKAMV
jgi:hypothetical protein